MELELKETLERLERGESVNLDHFSLEDLLEVAREEFYYLAEEIQQVVELRVGVPPRLARWSEFWHEEISAKQMLDRLQPEILCLEVLGYKGPRTVKLFRAAPEDRVKWARHLELKNEDLIQRVLEKPSIPFRWWICRLLVESFSKPVRIRLVQTPTEVLDEIEGFITEKNIEYEEVRQLRRVRDWEDLLASLKQIIDTRETRLPVNSSFRPIDGARVGTFTLRIPKTVDQLVEAGRILQNCLGSYSQTIRSGSVVILVEDDTRLLAYALEIHRKSVRQFVGHRNSEAPSEVKEPILKFLSEKGLINN